MQLGHRRGLRTECVLTLVVAIVGPACRAKKTDDTLVDTPAPSAPPMVATIFERFPLRTHTRWSEVDDKGSPPQWHEATYTKVGEGKWDLAKKGLPDLVTHFELRPEGWVETGIAVGGRDMPLDVPKLWLPATAAPGMKWKATHRYLPYAQPVERFCQIVANPDCAGGITVGCRMTRPDGIILGDEHKYCEKIGMTGFQEVEMESDAKTYRSRRWGNDVSDLEP